MTAGTISSAPIGAITFCGTTTEMAPSGRDEKGRPVGGTYPLGSGCTWLDYDRDGNLDLFVNNYIELDLKKVPVPGQTGYCQWKGIPVMCGPRGLPGGLNILYHNNGNGTFTDVSEKAGILKPGPRYSITAVSYDFDNDGWPDIYVAVDSEPSILYKNKHDGRLKMSRSWRVRLQRGWPGTSRHGRWSWRLRLRWLARYFKTNFTDDTPDLYHNNGDGTFSDVTFVSGLGVNTQYVCWGAGFMDYDNDGWTDIFHVTGHVYPGLMSTTWAAILFRPGLCTAIWATPSSRMFPRT